MANSFGAAAAAYEHVVGETWKPFERTLDKSSSAFDIPMAYIEISPCAS